MSAAAATASAAAVQRRRVRRSALTWGLIAAAFYLGFIVLILVRAAK